MIHCVSVKDLSVPVPVYRAVCGVLVSPPAASSLLSDLTCSDCRGEFFR